MGHCGILLGLTFALVSASTFAANGPQRIALTARMVDTAPGGGAGWTVGEMRGRGAALFQSVRQAAAAGGAQPFILQFEGPLTRAARAELAAAGVEIRAQLPGRAVLVALTGAQLAQAAGVPGLRWLGEWRADYKLEPALAQALQGGGTNDRIAVTIQTLTPADAARVAATLQRMGRTVSAVAPGTRMGVVRAEVARADIRALQDEGGVAWVEFRYPQHLCNDQAVGGARMNVTNVWTQHGLTGVGQIVGHADTGLDVGSTNGIHPDFAGKIVYAVGLSGGGFLGRGNVWNDPDGHGTHTAGSILGSGASSGGQYKGVAFGAKLVHQSVIDRFGLLTGIPADLHDLFHEAYTNGARIHSDSWGASVAGRYDTEAQQCDEYMWQHPDMLLVFAASNDGADADRDGVIDPDSLGSPGTAKNVLCVGAAESGRAAGSGGYSSRTYGNSWPADYGVPPISNDLISASPPGNGQGLAGFSSRGPTDDGRIKPDLVAPGTDIISAKSRHPDAGVAWGALAGNSNYMFSGGTSMSTPLTAGAAALVRQYYTDIAGMSNLPPSAALIKGTLVNGARSLSPGQYGAGAAREIPAGPRPNAVEGWGQVDVDGSLFPAPPVQLRFADWQLIANGETNRYALNVTGTNRLSVTLAYSDYPGFAGSARALVNDLDLLLIGPGGVTNRPGGAAEGNRVDNMEGIDVALPVPGVYTVRVEGVNVETEAQPYALVVRGAATLTEPAQRVAFEVGALDVAENAGAAMVYVQRLGGVNGESRVDVSTAPGSATSPADFAGTNLTLVFAPGVREHVVNISIVNDAADEPQEMFVVSLTQVVGAEIVAPTQVVVAIQDDDGAGQVEFDAPAYTVEEGGIAVAGLVRKLGSTGTISVLCNASNGTAASPGDFNGGAGVSVIFTNGQTRGEFAVNVHSDAVAESDETFWVRIHSISGGATIGSQRTSSVVIVENDFTNNVLVEDFNDGAAEGWTVMANADPAAVWRFDDPGGRGNLTGGSNGFAIADSDFFGGVDMDAELRSPPLDFSNLETVFLTFKLDFRWWSFGGDERAAVDVRVGEGAWENLGTVSNMNLRGPRTLTVDLSSYTGAPNAMIRFRYYQARNDWWFQVDDVQVYGRVRAGPPVQLVRFAESVVAVSESAGEALLPVVRTGDSAGTGVVQFATGGGSGVAGVDYVATNGTLVFGPGVVTNWVHVAVIDDGLTETGASVNVSLSVPIPPLQLAGPSLATIAIQDDDPVIASRLVEHFSGGLPPGWTVVANGETQAVWQFNDPGARSNLTGGAGGFAIADSAYYPTQAMDTELRSPPMDLSLFETVEIAYREDFNWYRFNGDERGDLDVSTNGVGGPWQTLRTLAGAEFRGPVWTQVPAPVAAGGSNVVVRFRYRDAISELWWQVDEVDVRGAVRGGNRDTDGDGIQDWWEAVHFAGVTNAVPGADADGDGARDGDEYWAGTHPRDAQDRLAIQALGVGTNASVVFPSVSGRVYRLDVSTNLLGGWLPGASVQGQGGMMLLGGPATNGAAFYRIEVVP